MSHVLRLLCGIKSNNKEDGFSVYFIRGGLFVRVECASVGLFVKRKETKPNMLKLNLTTETLMK